MFCWVSLNCMPKCRITSFQGLSLLWELMSLSWVKWHFLNVKAQAIVNHALNKPLNFSFFLFLSATLVIETVSSLAMSGIVAVVNEVVDGATDERKSSTKLEGKTPHFPCWKSCKNNLNKIVNKSQRLNMMTQSRQFSKFQTSKILFISRYIFFKTKCWLKKVKVTRKMRHTCPKERS